MIVGRWDEVDDEEDDDDDEEPASPPTQLPFIPFDDDTDDSDEDDGLPPFVAAADDIDMRLPLPLDDPLELALPPLR